MIGGGGALAASLAAAVALAPRTRVYATELGEIRSLPLVDGSMVAINTRSQVEVALSRRDRRINLRQGEAWFQVAKDRERPFVVSAGLARVRAVGTAFSVRREGGACDVLVTEGVVETWLEGSGRAPLRLGAGCKTVLVPGSSPQVVEAAQDITRALSWRNGQIALAGESLAEAAAEFNRYNARRILIDDAALSQRRFVGLFQTNDPDGFVAAVAATVGAKVSREPGVIRLTAAG
jgi:transmembrane sensor